jgi:hypothetical protein
MDAVCLTVRLAVRLTVRVSEFVTQIGLAHQILRDTLTQ